MNIRAKKTLSGRPRRKVLWGVAGALTVAGVIVTTTAFVGPMNATATAHTSAVSDGAAGNPVKGGNNRNDSWRLRTAEFMGVDRRVPAGTASLSVSARCPSRTEVTGGGFVITDRSDASANVTGIRVLASQRSGNGWTVTVTNPDPATSGPPGTGTGSVRAVVECAAIVRDNNNW
ncbi:hypothetical protein [Streptomyces sp. NPDC001070]